MVSYFCLVTYCIVFCHSEVFKVLITAFYVYVISNNGLLVTAITNILFYTDLIGTMKEINKILILQVIV